MKTTITKLAAIILFSLFVLVGNSDAKETKFDVANIETTESTLQLEDWMLSDSIWSTRESFFFETIVEKVMELEDWMTSKLLWNVKDSVEINNDLEQKIEVEPWMTDENIWNN